MCRYGLDKLKFQQVDNFLLRAETETFAMNKSSAKFLPAGRGRKDDLSGGNEKVSPVTP